MTGSQQDHFGLGISSPRFRVAIACNRVDQIAMVEEDCGPYSSPGSRECLSATQDRDRPQADRPLPRGKTGVVGVLRNGHAWPNNHASS